MNRLNERMLTAHEVMQIIGIRSHTTLREMIRRDGFPNAYEITRGKRHFAMSEVQAWLHKKMESQQKSAAQ